MKKNILIIIIIITILLLIVYKICGTFRDFILFFTCVEVYLITILILSYIFPSGNKSHNGKASLNFILPFILLIFSYKKIDELATIYLGVICILIPILSIIFLYYSVILKNKKS